MSDRSDPDPQYHLRVMSVFGIWAVVSLVFQRLLTSERTAETARFGWMAADVLLLTAMFYLAADEPLGPLLIGYPLLIVASGLFFRVRYVWFTTLMSLLSYASLLTICPKQIKQPHYPVIFAAVLAVMGFIVAYQVYRVRVLSRFYEGRRL